MTTHHRTLQDLHRRLLERFQFESGTHLLDYLTDLSAKLPLLITQRIALQKLNEAELRSFKKADTFEAYESLVFESNYTKFQERFPHFSTFNPSDIYEKVTAIIRSKTEEAKLEARIILQKVHSTFLSYHELLNLPARKLSEEDKERKLK